jgi:hypothetical protein
MGTSVFRIRTAVDFPPVLKSDHTMWSCRASLQRRAAPSFPESYDGADIGAGESLSSAMEAKTPAKRALAVLDTVAAASVLSAPR